MRELNNLEKIIIAETTQDKNRLLAELCAEYGAEPVQFAEAKFSRLVKDLLMHREGDFDVQLTLSLIAKMITSLSASFEKFDDQLASGMRGRN
jgi:hypothetical protein